MIVNPNENNLEYIDTVLKSYREFTLSFDKDAKISIEKLKDICKIILKAPEMTNQISKLIAHVVSTIGSDDVTQNDQTAENSDQEDYNEDQTNSNRKSDKEGFHDLRGSFNRRQEDEINDLIIQNNFDVDEDVNEKFGSNNDLKENFVLKEQKNSNNNVHEIYNSKIHNNGSNSKNKLRNHNLSEIQEEFNSAMSFSKNENIFKNSMYNDFDKENMDNNENGYGTVNEYYNSKVGYNSQGSNMQIHKSIHSQKDHDVIINMNDHYEEEEDRYFDINDGENTEFIDEGEYLTEENFDHHQIRDSYY